MSFFGELLWQDAAFLYGLKFEMKGGKPAIIIEVFPGLVDGFAIPADQVTQGVIRRLAKLHHFGGKRSYEFCGRLDGEKFGFGGCIDVQTEADVTRLIVKIPQVAIVTDQTCRECHGGGKKEGRKCDYCLGTGRKIFYDWAAATAVCYSLWLFFEGVEMYERSGDGAHYQLLHIKSLFPPEEGRDGGIAGVASPEMYRRLLLNWPVSLYAREIERVMSRVRDQMFPKQGLPYSFSAYDSTPGTFTISDSLDRGSVYPETGVIRGIGEGFQLCSCDMRTSPIVLIMLAGMAAICGRIQERVPALAPVPA